MVAVYFTQHWPTASKTAAGLRSRQLLELLHSDGWTVYCASTSEPTTDESWQQRVIRLNTNDTQHLVTEVSPDLIIYDRFITEEQYSWRCRIATPDALHLLDLQDVHGQREHRMRVALGKEIEENNVAARELASAHRCDLVVHISIAEKAWLTNQYALKPSQLLHLPFMQLNNSMETSPTYQERTGVVSIGNYAHVPNVDGLQWFKQNVWPLVRASLPTAQFNSYGYALTPKIQRLSDPRVGFHVNGFVENAHTCLSTARVAIAALRFGSGLKGKIWDAWHAGTPTVMTSVAAEGYALDATQQITQDTAEAFAQELIRLITDQYYWQNHQAQMSKRIENQQSVHCALAVLNRLKAAVGMKSNPLKYDLVNGIDTPALQLQNEVDHPSEVGDMRCSRFRESDSNIASFKHGKDSLQTPAELDSCAPNNLLQQAFLLQQNQSTRYLSRLIEIKESENYINREK